MDRRGEEREKCIYIYIKREREREGKIKKERQRQRQTHKNKEIWREKKGNKRTEGKEK